MNKVLVITYYWPPAGGIAVQRTVKFCKYLESMSWQPIILTVGDGNFEDVDHSNQDDVKHIQHVYRAKSREPHGWYHALRGGNTNTTGKVKSHAGLYHWLANFIRVNLFLPDSRIGWFNAAVKSGLNIIETHQPKLIFSTAPPFTCHLIARSLKKKSGIPWVADFRDAWLENNLYDKSYRLIHAKLINKHLEKSALSQADHIVTIGDNMKRLLSSKLGSQAVDKFTTITNGYEEDNIRDVQPNADYFYISYFGTLYLQRLPKIFLSALSSLIKQHTKLGNQLKLRIVGNIDSASLHAIYKYLPETSVIVQKPLSYTDFIQALHTPQLLLLTVDNVKHNDIIVTGKIFDYFVSGNPILAIGPTDGDAAHILKTMAVGRMFDYQDPCMEKYILEKFSEWQNNTMNRPVQRIPELERKQLTKKLSQVFDRLANTENG